MNALGIDDTALDTPDQRRDEPAVVAVPKYDRQVLANRLIAAQVAHDRMNGSRRSRARAFTTR
jgi:hypothetical protein